MARRKRNSKGRFVKASATRTARKTRRTRRAAPRVVRVKRAVLFNPRRRRARRVSAAPRRRSIRRYRSNPISLGKVFSMGTLKLAAFTGAGFLGTPLVSGFIRGYIPITDATTRKYVGYGVQAVSAYGLSIAAEKVVGKEAGRAVLAGGLAYVAVSVFQTLLPQLTGQTVATSAYHSVSGAGAQPMLGRYSPGMGSGVTNRTADRLNPANRY
jgi:hypothetical protein